MLLKIYCENSVKILWQHFQIVISYSLYYFSFLSFILFLLLFSLVFSPPHTYTHISPSSPFFFSTFHLIPEPPSLFLSLALYFSALYFSTFFFIFLLDSRTFSSSLCDKKWRKRQRERTNGLGGSAPLRLSLCSLCRAFRSTAATCLPPQCNLDGLDGLCLFFFFFFFVMI